MFLVSSGIRSTRYPERVLVDSEGHAVTVVCESEGNVGTTGARRVGDDDASSGGADDESSVEFVLRHRIWILAGEQSAGLGDKSALDSVIKMSKVRTGDARSMTFSGGTMTQLEKAPDTARSVAPRRVGPLCGASRS